MRNKRRVGVILLTLAVGFAAAAPWASVSYAEGKSFMLVRDGKTSTYSVDSAVVFGMELRQGDIIQTASSTFLEVFVTSVGASVQIAENTSFKCDADASGEKVSGELYYGRVRAKVAKLTGSSSFRITTPTLVAGVRGTDFGCDVIAVRGSSTASAPVLNRVFCFDGAVTVARSDEAPGKNVPENAVTAEPIVISKNEMVEALVSSDGRGAASGMAGAADGASVVGAAAPSALVKTPISPEVTSFWGSRGFTDVARAFPEGRTEDSRRRNLKIPAGASTAIIVLGTAACCGASWYSEHVDSDGVFVPPAYSAGIVMVGTGSVLALMSALLD
jgi:hypothetical protein